MKGGRALQEKKQFGFFAKICRPDFWILLLSLILSVDVVDQRKTVCEESKLCKIFP